MKRYRLKGCPKCGGDLQLEQDDRTNQYAWVCLQCGDREEIANVIDPKIARDEADKGLLALQTYGEPRLPQSRKRASAGITTWRASSAGVKV